LVGADIVEFNPVLDSDHKTEQLAIRLFHLLA
jgi:arginase family enzyme